MISMGEIWIVRHGERLDYVDQLWARKAKHPDDPPLAEKGHIQAGEVAARLQNEKIDHIFSSPFQRCVETANYIAEAKNLPIKIEPGICEVLWDFPPGHMFTEELHEKWPRVDLNYKPELVPEFAEDTDGDCIKRSAPVARTIRQKFSGNLLFVGHGASCAGIARAFTGRILYQGLCTVTKLTPFSSNGNNWALSLEGDASHLTDKTNLRPY